MLSLERAKAAPLTINLDMYKLEPTKNPQFHELLLSHIHSTIFLSANTPSTSELVRIFPDFPKSMPNLQSLSLGSNGQADWTQSDPFDFSAHTLKSLALRSIPFYPSLLSIRTLTKLTLIDYCFDLDLDVLLNFLEESYSLESANLSIGFLKPSLRQSQRQKPIGNRLQHLSISCNDTMDGRALISSIALRRGAALEVSYHGGDAKLADLLYNGLSTTHLPNLSSSIFMEYRISFPESIRLLGPDGSFSLGNYFRVLRNPFEEFPLFPLDSVRELHLECHLASIPTEPHSFPFPSLEVLVIDHSTSVSRVFSNLFPNPTSSPMLKTLSFLNCVITESFMDKLVRFTSDREDLASASPHRVVIVGYGGGLPSEASVERLRKCVSVVEVMDGWELPA